MKRLWCLAFVCFISLPFGASILTRMACSVSGNGTCTDPFCFITPISPTVNAANFGCGSLTRPLNKMNIRQQFYFKFLTNFVPVNIFPDVEFCSFMRKKDRNSFFYSILKTLNQKQPGLIHQCPYQGRDLQLKNLTVGASDLALWITGEYKLIYTFSDDRDKKILRVAALGNIARKPQKKVAIAMNNSVAQV